MPSTHRPPTGPSSSELTRTASPRVPFFVRLVGLLLAVAIVPLAGVALATMELNRDALKHVSRQLHLSVLSDAVRATRGEVSAVREELEAIGHLLLSPGIDDEDVRLTLAGARVTGSDRIDFVTLYDPGGRRLGTIKAAETADPATPERLSAPVLAELYAHGFGLGRVQAGGEGPRLELISAVRDGDAVKGFLSSAVSLASLGRALGEAGERRLGAADAVFVVDAQRRLVAASDLERVVAQESLDGRGIFAAIEGETTFRTAFGATPEFRDGDRPMLGALETIPELGLAAIAIQPLDVAYAPLERLRRALWWAFAGAVALALVGALIAARSVTKPVAALVQATVELASRSFQGLSSGLASRFDEFGTLGRAFERMAGELDRSQRRLLHESRARDSLARYLPGPIVELVLADPGRLRLAGERREVTVLFADVVDFTKLTAALPADQLVALLNELFTVATEVVQKRGGLVDKFMGDALMAVWGTPETKPDDPLQAVLAADDLRRWAEALNRKFRRVHGVELQLAMGVATGPAVAGNLGSDKRLEYTVVGPTVNAAASLESQAAPGQILVTQTTRDRVTGRVDLRDAGERKLRGHERATRVFEVLE